MRFVVSVGLHDASPFRVLWDVIQRGIEKEYELNFGIFIFGLLFEICKRFILLFLYYCFLNSINDKFYYETLCKP